MIKPILLLTTLCLTTALPLSAVAASWVDHDITKDRTNTSVLKNDTILMRTEMPFKEIRVSNTAVADVVVLTDKSFQVMGKTGGRTNVMLYDADRQLIDIVDVTVGHDLSGLKKTFFETFPRERIEVRPLADGVYLSGEVTTESVSKKAEKIAQAFAPNNVTNGLSVKDSHQVMLEVRFIEASRTTIKELGVGLLTSQQSGLVPSPGDFAAQTSLTTNTPVISGLLRGGFGSAVLDARIEALEDKGLIRTLAEPNLVAMSGETASFLAGGEIPIPVPGEFGQVAIEYRKFGVGLAFSPTVLDDEIINLKVAPEVSQLDPTTAVRIAEISVPGIRVRRANTTIELRNGQSFAIAGLLQSESSNNRSQVPWLGDIPILGTLFSSTRFQENETELVIMVTPHLAQPVSDRRQLASPLDDIKLPSDFEAFAKGHLEGGKSPLALSDLSGDYGTVLE
ncbi:type II and III secretion system protein family protein [Fretibacter rubidus]|uniref:type II and III secretion system protein family protein n=1 Tax=Fretibacter rubidus TaxID=570162 RepID=UPI00352AECD5